MAMRWRMVCLSHSVAPKAWRWTTRKPPPNTRCLRAAIAAACLPSSPQPHSKTRVAVGDNGVPIRVISGPQGSGSWGRKAVTASSALLDYLQALLAASRRHADVRVGLSPRAGLALLGAARAWAFLSGRQHVLPEDVQAVFVPLAAHRLVTTRGASGDSLARSLLADVAVN